MTMPSANSHRAPGGDGIGGSKPARPGSHCYVRCHGSDEGALALLCLARSRSGGIGGRRVWRFHQRIRWGHGHLRDRPVETRLPAGPSPCGRGRLGGLLGGLHPLVRDGVGAGRLPAPHPRIDPVGGDPVTGHGPFRSDGDAGVQPGWTRPERDPDPPGDARRLSSSRPPALRHRELRPAGYRCQRSPPMRNRTVGVDQRGAGTIGRRPAVARGAGVHRHGPAVPAPHGVPRALPQHLQHRSGHGQDPPGARPGLHRLLRDLVRHRAGIGLRRPVSPTGRDHGPRRCGRRQRPTDPAGHSRGPGRRAVTGSSVGWLRCAIDVPPGSRSAGLLPLVGLSAHPQSAPPSGRGRPLPGHRGRSGYRHPAGAQRPRLQLELLRRTRGRQRRQRRPAALPRPPVRHRHRRLTPGRSAVGHHLQRCRRPPGTDGGGELWPGRSTPATR